MTAFFPIQPTGRARPGLHVMLDDAKKAYVTYEKLGHGSQSLERIGERGGFGDGEFAYLFNGLDPYGNGDLDVVECHECSGEGYVILTEDGGMPAYCGICCGAGKALGEAARKLAGKR